MQLRTGTTLAAIATTLALAPPATAATFNVNSTADASDPAAGNGVCDADPLTAGLQCTLRAAIQEAGTPAFPGQDTINVPAGTYALNSPSELVVDSALIIDGASAAATTIRQQLNGRVIRVAFGASLDLRDVTVRNGAIAADGGGILAGGPLVVRRSVIRNNEAIGGSGGGIHGDPNGPLTIQDTVIGGSTGAGNSAGQAGGGVFAGAGLVMRDSSVRGNVFDGTGPSGRGAGIDSFGTTTITRSTIAGNGDADTDSGGGISHFGDGLTLADSTLSGNHVESVGSALVVRGATSATARNVTVSGNTGPAAASLAGPVFVQDGTLTLQQATIAGNSAPAGSAIRLFTSAALETATVTVRASIVEAGAGTACGASGSGTQTITSAGFNVSDDSSCAFAGPGDVTAGAQLGPLASNGGPTRTMTVAPSSPAVNRVTSGCPPPAADQRGVPRPQGSRCDSGAYELARCRGAIVNRVGTAGADVLAGTAAGDGFLLFGGADRASGGPGNDRVCGGAGNDRLRGQAGRDQLFGQAGRDRLLGGRGRDRLVGGGGRDRLLGGPGRDLLLGGPGRDRQRQ